MGHDSFERAPWLPHLTDYITHCVTNTATNTHCNTLQHTAILGTNHSYMGHDSFMNAPQLTHLTDYITHGVTNKTCQYSSVPYTVALPCICVAVCCSVLRCGAVLHSVLQSVVACHFDVSKSVFPHNITVPCICVAVSHCVALCCTALQSLSCVKIHPNKKFTHIHMWDTQEQ